MAAILHPMYTAGPLSLLHQHHQIPDDLASLRSNLWKEESGCLEWLDGRAPGSVVYVNFGSVTVMSNEQLVMFAWGLADSEYEFLWVIRPDLVRGHAAVLPSDFVEEARERGMPGYAGRRRRRRVSDAQWLELDSGNHRRWGGDAVVALLRGAADQLQVRVHGVGKRDGDRKQREEGGSGGADKGADGERREGEGDEEEPRRRRAAGWKEAAE